MDLRASKQKQKPLVALSLPCLAKWAQLQRMILLIVALISPPRVLGKSLMLMESFAAHHAVSTYDDARQCSASGHVRALGPLVNFLQTRKSTPRANIPCQHSHSLTEILTTHTLFAYADTRPAHVFTCILHALIMHTMRHHHIQSIFSKPFVRAVSWLLHPSK